MAEYPTKQYQLAYDLQLLVHQNRRDMFQHQILTTRKWCCRERCEKHFVHLLVDGIHPIQANKDEQIADSMKSCRAMNKSQKLEKLKNLLKQC